MTEDADSISSLFQLTPLWFNVKGEDVIAHPVFMGTDRIGEAIYTGIWMVPGEKPYFFKRENPSPMTMVKFNYAHDCPTCGGSGKVVQ